MADLVITPTPPVTTSAAESIVLTAVVADADWVGLYDRLQIFRSELGAAGPFTEITGPDWLSPRLPVDGGDPPAPPVTGRLVAIVGLTLELIVQTTPVSITFTGVDPLTLTQCATQIASANALLSWVDSTGQLVVETSTPGAGSSLSIVEGDAAQVLGLPTGTAAQGKDPRQPLVPGRTTYIVQDPFGDRGYFYRLQFLNRSTGAVSEPSVAFSASDDATVVGADNVSVGHLRAATLEGKPLVDAEVKVFNSFSGAIVGGRVLASAALVKRTDATGYVEFQLVRGADITVSIKDTSLMRRITVPTDAASFDLLDPSIGASDTFKAAVPNIVIAERRSL